MKKILILLLLLSSCSLVPDYERPAIAINDSKTQIAPLKVEPDWWKHFSSPTLDSLMTKALAQNNDLQASLQRIAQARASAKIAGASLLPQVDANANIGRNTSNGDAGNTASTSKSGGIGISYEIDLFGKNRASIEAAEERALGSQFDYDALALVTETDVATAYLSAVTTTERLRIARENRENISATLNIIEAQYKEGRTSGLELAQQQAALADTDASIAGLQQQHQAYVNQLAVLVGDVPQNFTLKEETLSTFKVPLLATSISSRLLEQRPDIASAEAQLKAANADIGAARAAFFPSLDIGFSAALSGDPFAVLTTLTASALAPIFHGGALEGQVELTEAKKQELAANYRKVVLTAFQEAGDAYTATKTTTMQIQALDTSATKNGRAFALARDQYKNGAIDFQTLLITQRDLFRAQDSLAQGELTQILADVQLYKALGGGWSTGAR